MNIGVFLAVSCTLGVAEFLRCPEVELLNGTLIHLRHRLRLDVQFKCNTNFELVGAKFAICRAGVWNTEIPFCVGTTCPMTETPSGMIVEKLYSGGVLSLTCDPGLARIGAQRMMCLAGKWNQPLPVCAPIINMKCDFEHEDLCGWSQDTEDEFDWIWHQGNTPTPNTGPLNDHTLNSTSGHYLFIESSAPQKFGHRARLLSPIYTSGAVDGMCLQFYYHMFGPDLHGEVGNLDVYILLRNTNSTSNNTTQHIFHRAGNQGDDWIWAEVYIPPENTTLQLAFQATRLKGSSGDIAIDDVRICNCSQSHDMTATTATRANNRPRELTTEGTLISEVPVSASEVREIMSPTTDTDDIFMHADRRKAAGIMSTNPSFSRTMSSGKTHTNINILADTYPPSDKTQRVTSSVLHIDSSTQKAQTDTNTLSHNYYSDKTQLDTNIRLYTQPSSDQAQTVTNILSYMYTFSHRTHTSTSILSTQNLVDNEKKVSDTCGNLLFETRRTLILHITLLFVALLAALYLTWSWVRHRHCRGRWTDVEIQSL